MTINALGLDHVQLTVPPELETAARRFYGDLLGLPEIQKPQALQKRGGCWFALGSVQLHIALEANGSGHDSRRHVCLLVRDLAAARRVLEAAGIAITGEPVTVDGLERFFVRDPAGNRLEIGERTAR
jgi:catechol 2,3-dioxygenase-like lactoylglutathione lyase family enzyme